MASDQLPSFSPNRTAPHAQRDERRCFRILQIPLDWTMEYMNCEILKLFTGYRFDISSLCYHPTGKSKTALITFAPKVPQELKTDHDTQVLIKDCKLIFGSCLGITTLSEPIRGSPIKADVLFVHGLGGHAIGSWTAPNGHCWPRDCLGKDMAGIRVMTFGYEARLNRDTSTSRLSDFGKAFLSDLSMLRNNKEHHKRPLFLVGHSFGGTIITWALHEMVTKRYKTEYETTLQATRCVTFFGTPHLGMSIDFLVPITEGRLHESSRRTLEDIRSNSEMLKMLRDTLTSLQKSITFITCEEQRMTAAQNARSELTGDLYQAVDSNTARLNGMSEVIIPIDANHRDMIKFSHNLDRHYLQILAQLLEALESCRKIIGIQTLTEDQRKDLLTMLRMPEDEEKLKMIICPPEEANGDWFTECTAYRDWSIICKDLAIEAPILYIKGRPGSGKSTLMKHISLQQQRRNDQNITITHFFSQYGSPSQCTAKGMYQSLLQQLIENMELVPCETKVLERWIRSRSADLQISDLRELLVYLIPLSERPIFLFVDALDQTSSADLPDVIKTLHSISKVCNSRPDFRLCLSSINTGDSLKGFRSAEINLDTHAGHTQDILRYAESRLNIGHDDKARQIHQQIARLARGNFLWAVVALNVLSDDLTQNGRGAVFERLDVLPPSLPDLYRSILSNDHGQIQGALLVLRLVCQAPSPPTIRDLYLAAKSNTNSQHFLMKFLHSPPADETMKTFILNTSKGLLRVEKQSPMRVRLLHPSVSNILENLETSGYTDPKSGPYLSPGLANEHLKNGCLDVLRILDAPLGEHKQLSLEAVKYAIDNILTHANEAARGGISQQNFLSIFPRKVWIQLTNSLSIKPKYHENTNLLYILAELSLSELILSYPHSSAFLSLDPNMQQIPLFVALETMHIETISALLSLEVRRKDRYQLFTDQHITPQHHETLCDTFIERLDKFYRGNRIRCSMAIDGCNFRDCESVVKFMVQPGNEILHLFLILAGRVPSNLRTFDELIMKLCSQDVTYRSNLATPSIAAYGKNTVNHLPQQALVKSADAPFRIKQSTVHKTVDAYPTDQSKRLISGKPSNHQYVYPNHKEHIQSTPKPELVSPPRHHPTYDSASITNDDLDSDHVGSVNGTELLQYPHQAPFSRPEIQSQIIAYPVERHNRVKTPDRSTWEDRPLVFKSQKTSGYRNHIRGARYESDEYDTGTEDDTEEDDESGDRQYHPLNAHYCNQRRDRHADSMEQREKSRPSLAQSDNEEVEMSTDEENV